MQNRHLWNSSLPDQALQIPTPAAVILSHAPVAQQEEQQLSNAKEELPNSVETTHSLSPTPSRNGAVQDHSSLTLDHIQEQSQAILEVSVYVQCYSQRPNKLI